MVLEGTLRQFTLREILELMVYSSVTGALEIQTSDGAGYIYTHMGEIYHATLDVLIGSPAIWQLFEERDGAFRFIAGKRTDQRTILEDISSIANEGEQRAMEWAAVRPRISSNRLVPIFEPGQGRDHIQIHEDDWPIMSAIDGQRTIAEVAAFIAMDSLDVARGLVRLMDRGLVRLGRPEPVAPVPQIKAASSAARPERQAQAGGGLLARTLASLGQQPEPAVQPTERRDHAPPRTAPAVLESQEDEIVRLLRGG